MTLLTDSLRPFTRLCIGSLPFLDPDEALRFIRVRPYLIPFWPELPGRGAAELMVARADRALSNSWSGYDSTDGAGFLALRDALADGWNPSLLKLQVCGSTTHARWSSRLTGSFGDRLAHAVDGVLRQVHWQVSELRERSAAPIVVFLDEPGLDDHWSVGEWDLITRAVSYLYTSLSNATLSFGIHSCAVPTVRIFDLPADILALDLSSPPDGDVRVAVRRAAVQGRVIIPGVLPSIDAPLPTEEFLTATLEGWGMKFADDTLLSATCGHAAASLPFLQSLYPLPAVPT